MPRLSVWTIRTALVYLLAGFTFGSLILIQKGTGSLPWAWALLPAHIESLLVGWTTQLAMGVAYWILPRLSGSDRGHPTLAWSAIILLNVGILAVLVQPWLGFPGGLRLFGRICEALGVAAFAVLVWRRIRPTYPGQA